MDRGTAASGGNGSLAVAALYGWDLEEAPVLADPQTLLSEGFELLAMDPPAVTAMIRAGLPFLTVEDWLARTGLDATAVAGLAASAAEGWPDHFPDDLNTGNVHWPNLEFQDLAEMWSALAAGLLLGSAFRVIGVTRLRFLHGYPRHLDDLGSTPHESVPRLWMRTLSDIAEPFPLPRASVRERMRLAISRGPLGWPLRRARHELAVLRCRFAIHALHPVIGEGCTVVALAGRELLRSAPVVRRIQEHLGPAVVTIPWMNTREQVRLASGLSPAPSLPTPPLERGSRREERKLRHGILRNLEVQDLGQLEAAREEVGASLAILAQKWAMHARRLRWMRSALNLLDARFVIATRLDVKYHVPIEAAKSLRIPVLTLPHAVLQWSPPHLLAPADRVAHLTGIANPTSQSGSMRVSQDALIEYEYPHRVQPPIVTKTDHRFTILAVTDGFGAINRPSTGIRTHASALTALARLARARSDDLRIQVKPHPGTSAAQQLLVDACARDALDFLPREDDLIALLGAADLIIGVNCHEASLVHAVRSSVPVIRFLTEDPEKWKGALWTELRSLASFWNRTVTTVRDAGELERLVDDLVARPEGLEVLRDASRSAAACLVPAEGQERLVDIIDELLAASVRERASRVR